MSNTRDNNNKYKPGNLKEGQAPRVLAVEDSAGTIQPLVVTSDIPKADRPTPRRRKVPLHDVLEEMLEHVDVGGANHFRGWRAAIYLARAGSWRYKNLELFSIAWEDLGTPALHPERDPSIPPTFEEALLLANVNEEDFMGDLGKICYWYGTEKAKLMVSAGMPTVIQAAQESAMVAGRDGLGDRKLLAQMAGMITEGGGTSVVVNNTNQVGVKLGLPEWQENDKVLKEVGKK